VNVLKKKKKENPLKFNGSNFFVSSLGRDHLRDRHNGRIILKWIFRK
jgi:hypothetical protein